MDVWNTVGSRCTKVAGSLGSRWVVVVQTLLVHWDRAASFCSSSATVLSSDITLV